MKRLIALVFLQILFSGNSFSQNNWFHYEWDKHSSNDFNGLSDHVYNYDMKAYADNIYIGEYYKKFSEEMTAAVNYDILHGNFYSDFSGYETYLRKVLKEIIKDTAVLNRIKIYLYRDDSFNASMNESGILRLNIGALARLSNEAELALLLGHETAHFLNSDLVKRYGRRLEVDNSFNHPGPTSFINLMISNPIYTMYWNNKEEESTADFVSINLMKKSNYSLRSASNLFKILKRMETRAEYGDFMGGIFKTHPDPGDRAKQLKFLTSDSINKWKKNFLVDSVAFMKLKDLCYKESVNVGFVNNNFFDLMSLSFTEYLFDPANKKNLAVLIESMRRFFAFYEKKDLKNKSFILYPYQNNNFNKPENYRFLDQETPCILKYISKGFLDIGKDDLKRIKAIELLDTANVKFTTYEQAYTYFINKASELNCTECAHYKFFGPNADFSNAEGYLSSSDIFKTADLINEKGEKPSFQNDHFIVLPTGLTKTNLLINRKSVKEQNDLYDNVVSSLKQKVGNNVLRLSDLSYSDQHAVLSLLNLANYFVGHAGNAAVVKNNTDWTAITPEHFSYFKKNNIKNIYVCDFNLIMTRKNFTYGQPHNINEKAIEQYLFYKISVPAKTGNSLNMEVIQDKGAINEDINVYAGKFVNKFNFFYNATKN